MSVTIISSSHEARNQAWAEGLHADQLKRTSLHQFEGKDSRYLVHNRTELEKGPGENVRIGLRMQLDEKPKTSGESVEDAEHRLSTAWFNFNIDEFVDAVRFENVMSRQRVNFDHRTEAKAALADLLANAWDKSGFNQLAGITTETTTYAGNNTIAAIDSTRQYFSGGAANEAALATTDYLSLDDITECVHLAKTLTPGIRPAYIPFLGRELYVLFVHPTSNKLMRLNDTRYNNLVRDAMQGGMIGDNPQLTGAQLVYEETLICENTRVPLSATLGAGGQPVRRNIFCGAQALASAYGRFGGTPSKYRWVEKLFEYDREMGVMAGFVGGLARTRFTYSTEEIGGPTGTFDFASIVVSSSE